MRGGRLFVGLLSFLVSATLLAGVADLSWTPPTQRTDGSPLTNLAGYRIYYGCAESRTYPNVIQVDDPGAISYRVEDLPDAGTCYFAVSAVDTDGLESGLSNEASKFMGQGGGGPDPEPLPPADPTSGPLITWALDAVEEPGTGDVMALTRVGSVVVDASGGNGSTSVDVPANCNAVVAFWGHWAGNSGSTLSGLTLDGDSFLPAEAELAEGATPNAAGVGVAVLVNPSTGTQTLAWTWSDNSARAEGGEIILVYIQGANTADPVRDAAVDSTTETGDVSVTIDTESDDLVLGFAGSFEGFSPDISLTEFIDNALINSHMFDVGEDVAPSSPSTTVDMTGEFYSWIAAISLKAAASAVEGSVTEASAFGATFAPAATQRVTFTTGIQAASDLSGQASTVGLMSSAIEAGEAFSGRAVALGAIVEALEAGDTDAAAQAAVAALSAQVETDAQYAAIAQAAAAIQAGLEAGEDWAAIAAAEAGLLAGAELGETFASETQSAQTAALSAGTEAAASFLGAVAAYGLLSAGAEAGDAFSASAAISGAWSASAEMGAVFGISSSNEVSLTAAAEVQSVFLSVIDGRGGISEPVDAGSAFSGVSSALALLSAGVLLGADFTAVSSADFSVVRAVATVRAIHRISADVRPVGGISTTIH